MCGIFAELSLGPQPDPRAESLEPVLAALHHRGPDARGTFVESRGDWRVRLAHTRLKVIDLSERAAQPMAGAGGSLRLVYNGEIYNFFALRRELERLGHVFRSTSDTEVLLAALEQWGVGALRRLRGIFALALYDARDGSLFLARDRFGVKPLYYSRDALRVTAASEVRAILASGSVEFHPDAEAVGSYLAFGSVCAPRTIARDVWELPPGHWLRFTRGRVETGCYWKLPGPLARPPGEEEAAREVQRLVKGAVRSQLVADVPLGAFLSGGMDSSAIVACVAEERPLDAFTVGFGEADWRLDEIAVAAAFARKLGVRHHVLRLSADACLGALSGVLDSMDQPSSDGANTWVVSLAARSAGITVALSGLGGDELFGGYPHLRAAHERSGWIGALGTFAPAARAAGMAMAPFAGRDVRIAKAVSLLASGGDPARLYAARRSLILLERSADLLPPERAARWRAHGNHAFVAWDDDPRVEPAQAQTEIEYRNYLPNTLLRDADVMSMRHGLEVRVPLLDHELVEFVLSLPLHYRFKRGKQKPLLAAAVPLVPETSPAQKKGFTMPFATWLRGPLRGSVEARLSRLHWAGEYVTTAGSMRLWRRFLGGEDRLWTRVWAIHVLDRWLERHLVVPRVRAPYLRMARIDPLAASAT